MGGDAGLNTCYVLGSVLFLVGSVFLVTATSVPAYACSPLSKSGSLFWGSVCFLMGSIAFTYDSVMHYNPGTPAMPWLTKGGYSVFIAGRFYFVWGSLTPDCGVLLQRTPLATVMARAS